MSSTTQSDSPLVEPAAGITAASEGPRVGQKRTREEAALGEGNGVDGPSSSVSTLASQSEGATASAAPAGPTEGSAATDSTDQQPENQGTSAASSANAAAKPAGRQFLTTYGAGYSVAYKPGILLTIPEVLEKAKRIGSECGADFIEASDRKKLKAAEARLVRARAAVIDCRNKLQQILAPPPTAPGAPLPAPTPASVIEATAASLRHAEAEASRAQEELDRAKQNAELHCRKNMTETLLRVTLSKDASDINERYALAGAAQEEVAYTQAPSMSCENCHNTDESLFLTEYKSGDVICQCCGAVALEHQVFDGDWTRSFEGEESTSQIGPRPDPLLSARYNLRTGMAAAPGVSNARLRELRLAQEFVELNQSSYGAGDVAEQRTREGYKDKQKRKAFDRLETAAERLRMSEATVLKAKGLFAAFRDNREHVQRFDEACAAALIVAWEEAEYAKRQEEFFKKEALAAAALAGGGGAGAASSSSSSSIADGGAASGASSNFVSAATLDGSGGDGGFGGEGGEQQFTKAAAASSSSSSSSAPAPAPKPLAPPPLTAEQKEAARRREAERKREQDKKARVLGYVGSDFLDVDAADEDDDSDKSAPASDAEGAGATKKGKVHPSMGTKRAKLERPDAYLIAGKQQQASSSSSSSGSAASSSSIAAGSTGNASTSISSDEINALYARMADRELINPEVADREDYKAPS